MRKIGIFLKFRHDFSCMLIQRTEATDVGVGVIAAVGFEPTTCGL